VSVTNIFGPIVTGRQVRLAMHAHLKLWIPTYLAEIARGESLDPAALPVFRSWVSALDLPEGKYEEHQMPSCVVVAPGLLAEPEQQGGGFVTTWAVSVGCVVSGQDRENTFELAEVYAAAVRSAVVQNSSLGGFATATDWLGERYDDIPNDMLRTLAAGSVQFAVEVQSAVRRNEGPDEPLANPIPDPGPRATFAGVQATTEGA
jgi:hypothetical protein